MFGCQIIIDDNYKTREKEREDEIKAFSSLDEALKTVQTLDQYKDCKPIIREVGSIDKNKFNEEELEKTRNSLSNLKVYPLISGNPTVMTPPIVTFEEAFSNNVHIMNSIKNNNFVKPSPIQSQMWSIIFTGRDVIGISQTGSGKTLAFLLPAFLHIDAQYEQYGESEVKPSPSVLVICPTRELAQQIDLEVSKYTYKNYKSVCLYGGVPREVHRQKMRGGAEIIIATPGRLADLASEGILDLKRVTYVVLDEADRMLDMGFEASIARILLEIRPDRMTVLTSATWPEKVRSLAKKYTKDAAMVVVGTMDLTTCQQVTQYFEFVHPNDRFARIKEIAHFLENSHKGNFKLMIFVRSKVMADHLSSDFSLAGISAASLHSGMSQEGREESLDFFRKGEIKILVATDVASRGIDVPDITHVVNFDFPGSIEEYVHRVGRTGRAGRFGEANSFLYHNDRSQYEELIKILEESCQKVPDWLRQKLVQYKARVASGIDSPLDRGGGRGQRGRGGDFKQRRY